MGNRVYMITVESVYSKHSPLLGDIYYVIAENEDDAAEHLREQIRKYYFKAKLSQKASDSPSRLGERIIVDGWVTEDFASSNVEYEFTDVTAMAFMYKTSRRESWEHIDITMMDAVDA